MKFLAVFGLALVVFAVDRPEADSLRLSMYESQLKLLEAEPSNPDYCFKVLSMIDQSNFRLADYPKVTFPLARYCMRPGVEAGVLLLPKDLRELREMSVAHLAALVFMLRVKKNDAAAKLLYNDVMEEHFSAEFEAKLHERPYPEYPLMAFNSLKTEPERQFFMLWTVQMFDKRKEHESDSDCRRRLLRCSEEVAWIFVRMGFLPPDLLLVGMFLLQKEPPTSADLELLSGTWLQFLSLTRDDYLGLQEPEKAQLHAFLEKYLKARWKCLDLLVEDGLSEEEFKQFQDIFELEPNRNISSSVHYMYPVPGMVTDPARYLDSHIQLGCPVFFPKKKFDFYVEKTSSTPEEILTRKRGLLKALEIVKEAYLNEKLICSQIECAIKECKSEIAAFEVKKRLTKSEESKKDRDGLNLSN